MIMKLYILFNSMVDLLDNNRATTYRTSVILLVYYK